MSQAVSLGAYLSLAKHWLLDVPMNDVLVTYLLILLLQPSLLPGYAVFCN